jgi:hypothetical protein
MSGIEGNAEIETEEFKGDKEADVEARLRALLHQQREAKQGSQQKVESEEDNKAAVPGEILPDLTMPGGCLIKDEIDDNGESGSNDHGLFSQEAQKEDGKGRA